MRIWLGTLLCLPGLAGGAAAAADCRPLDQRPVKIEAWVSKTHAPQFPLMRRELAQMGNTHAVLFPYPGHNPSRVMAIGRCVPAYIARHALERALHYYGEIKSLVHPGFVAPHWIGLATSLFAENSQRPVTRDQVERLLDPALGTSEFHDLYRQFTRQEPTVRAFGRILPNPQLME